MAIAMAISNVHVRTLTEFLEIVMVIIFSPEMLAAWVTQAIYIYRTRGAQKSWHVTATESLSWGTTYGYYQPTMSNQ